MSNKRFILLPACCLALAVGAGCRSQTTNVSPPQSTTTTTTQRSSSTQESASNSNSQTVAVNQNISAQNSSTTAADAGRRLDPCSLITTAEVSSVQGEEVKETRASPGNSRRLAVSQCFYLTTTPSKSVSLEVTERLAGQPGALSPREFWEERFERAGGGKERERERKREGKREAEKREAERRESEEEEEEEEGPPPTRIEGVGDEAFWAGNARVGALYVLKGNSFIRLSIGGIADQNLRLEKTKALAQQALKRLKD